MPLADSDARLNVTEKRCRSLRMQSFADAAISHRLRAKSSEEEITQDSTQVSTAEETPQDPVNVNPSQKSPRSFSR